MENLRIERRNAALIYAYAGEITIEVTPALKQAMQEAFNADEVRTVVFDLSEVRFMDSSGIGFLISLNSKAQNLGKSFLILKPSQQVSKTLELVQLRSFFTIVDDEDELLTHQPL